MARIAYKSINFRTDALDVINKANAVCAEYERQGLVLTLRQLYYQFVSRNWIPNRDTEYKRLGNIINDARVAGKLDWDYLEDRSRNLASLGHWTNPADIIRSAAHSYRLDKWADQKYYVEVWVEKEALAGVIGRTANRLDVPYFACKGYVSQSEMHGAARRLARHKKPVVIHLGDHDPSGIDMSRDIEDRLSLFGAGHTLVNRIALNMDQVEAYNPPPNPAKLTDTRATDYIARYGDESWELDALDPATLNDLITETVLQYRDEDAYARTVAEEEEDKEVLTALTTNWTVAEEWVKDAFLSGNDDSDEEE